VKNSNLNGFLHASYSRLLGDLYNSIREEWNWPTPDAGFALYIREAQIDRENHTRYEFAKPESPTIPNSRLNEAPIIASYSFFYSAYPSRTESEDQKQLARGLSRLSKRTALRADRQSFFYRPVELVGICIGARETKDQNSEGIEWLRALLREGTDVYRNDTFWRNLLAGWGSAFVGVNWHPDTVITPSEMDVPEKALALWIGEQNPSVAQSYGITERFGELEECFLEQVGTQPMPQMSLDKLAVTHTVLNKLVVSVIEDVVQAYRDPKRQKQAEQQRTEQQKYRRQVESAAEFCKSRGRRAYWLVRILGLPLLLGSIISIVSLYLSLPRIPSISAQQSIFAYVLVFYAVTEVTLRWIESDVLQEAASWAEEKWTRRWQKKVLGKK